MVASSGRTHNHGLLSRFIFRQIAAECPAEELVHLKNVPCKEMLQTSCNQKFEQISSADNGVKVSIIAQGVDVYIVT